MLFSYGRTVLGQWELSGLYVPQLANLPRTPRIKLHSNQLNYSSRRGIREQTLRTTPRTFLVNREETTKRDFQYWVRLPEMGKKTVNFQPLLIGGLSNPAPKANDIGTVRTQIKKLVGHIKGDLSEMLVVGCEGTKRGGNPLGAVPAHKTGFFEFYGPRKVNRARRSACQQKSAISGNVGTTLNGRTVEFALDREGFKRRRALLC